MKRMKCGEEKFCALSAVVGTVYTYEYWLAGYIIL